MRSRPSTGPRTRLIPEKWCRSANILGIIFKNKKRVIRLVIVDNVRSKSYWSTPEVTITTGNFAYLTHPYVFTFHETKKDQLLSLPHPMALVRVEPVKVDAKIHILSLEQATDGMGCRSSSHSLPLPLVPLNSRHNESDWIGVGYFFFRKFILIVKYNWQKKSICTP